MAPTLFATLLARHPSLKPIPRDVMYARHPRPPNAGYTPPVHFDRQRGPSIFISANGPYQDRLLPDGRTIEYHPSTNTQVNSDLESLLGKEVTLYASLARGDCREGRVIVQKQTHGVYHLCLLPLPPLGASFVRPVAGAEHPAVAAAATATQPAPKIDWAATTRPAPKINWADM